MNTTTNSTKPKKKTISVQTKVIVMILLLYLALVLWYTILNRTPGFYDAQFNLFWSYKEWLSGDKLLGREILANIAMFVPIGFLLTAIMPHRKHIWLVIFIAGFLISAIIEVLQLELMRGLFEYDDIFNNTLGALLGYQAYNLLEKLVNKSYITRIVFLFGVMLVTIGILVCTNERNEKGELQPITPRYICFQTDTAIIDGGKLILTGFAFCNNRKMSDFSLILRSTITGKEVKANVKYGLQRSDVARYFNNTKDYSKAGYWASVSGIYTDEEYEIILRPNNFVSFSTDVFITGTDIHYTKQNDFVPPMVIGTWLEKIVKNGYLRVYQPDYACYVYQYNGYLYWIADNAFVFEDSGKTYIQYQLWTTQPKKLPQIRLKNKWYWDNIGDYFEKHEITGIVNCGKYRVCRRKIPKEYSVTSILTGFHKNGKWIWKNYFRPVYEFRAEVLDN